METNFTSLMLILLTFFIYALWREGFKRYFLTKHRQTMFELRDDLFDMAFDGKIKFDSALYTYFRKNINARIRYAHRLNLIDFAITKMYSIKVKGIEEIDGHILKQISHIKNQGIHDELMDIKMRADLSAISLFIKSNPLLWLPFVLLIIYIVSAEAVKNIKSPNLRNFIKDMKDFIRDEVEEVLKRILNPYWQLPAYEKNLVRIRSYYKLDKALSYSSRRG